MYAKNYSGKSFLLLLLFICLPFCSSFAQGFSCGSVPSADYLNYLLSRSGAFSSNKTTTASNPSKLATLKTISITAWIVKDSLRNPNLTPAQINAAIVVVNKDFAPMNLVFKVCAFKYIENFQFDSLDSSKPPKDKEPQLYAQFHDSSTINMYFVTVIKRQGTQALPAGYAISPGGKDLIVITKKAVPDTKTISHEIGHYFGLLHTFETKLGTEIVNRNPSNCGSKGDLFCDTEADPDPSGTAVNCEFTTGTKDANGEYFTPPLGNIMSYYPASCKCGFSPEQFAFMVDIYLTQRKYLY